LGNEKIAMTQEYCSVAVRMPGKNSELTYIKPTGFNVFPGKLVKIPLGKRLSNGCVISVTANPLNSDLKYKQVSEEFDATLDLSFRELELFQWMARYYHYSLGLLIFDCLPNKMKRAKEFNVMRGDGKAPPLEIPHNLLEIASDILIRGRNFGRHYVHGVTGSGKSFVFLTLVKKIIEESKSVLYMVPEINLTPQFSNFFLNYLNCPVYVFHSGLTDGQRYQVWRQLKNTTEACLVLGVRSSIFLPMENVGLIIVDEEHDSSFKQIDRCPYNARDVAVKKAQIYNVPVVMGSATPTLENYHNFRHNLKDTESLATIEHRLQGKFPQVEIQSIRGLDIKSSSWPLSPESINLIRETLTRGEQTLVFVNRLGFSNSLQCNNCGHKFIDPNTNTALRYFKQKNILSSSYSEYKIPVPDQCPECGNLKLAQVGYGTEKVQHVLQDEFSNYVCDRFDRDEIKNIKELEQKLDSFMKNEIHILVGTQMLSKGHNFPKVTLVIVLGIDQQMNYPDFRSIERTYQLLTQIIGRAGRYSDHARVVVQSLTPSMPLFQYVKEHSFDQFYKDEMQIREMAKFPPFAKIAMVYLNGKTREVLATNASKFSDLINQFIQRFKLDGIELLGPSPAMVEKRTGYYTWYFMLKCTNVNSLHQALAMLDDHRKALHGVEIKIDVDPYMCL
jgi:primosomal protein N' (replication factor Y)